MPRLFSFCDYPPPTVSTNTLPQNSPDKQLTKTRTPQTQNKNPIFQPFNPSAKQNFLKNYPKEVKPQMGKFTRLRSNQFWVK
jgi:hypothetical protein